MSFLLFLHLLAAAFWLGGLLMLPLAVIPAVRLPEREAGRFVIRRLGWSFAAGAGVAWLLLLVTGVVMARSHLSSLSDLGTTHFGRTLEDKSGLAIIALAAAVAHVVTGRSGSRTLIRTSRALALVTLLATLGVFYYATLLD